MNPFGIPISDAGRKVGSAQTETYAIFRTAIPKPTGEDAHLRHILRFYVTRAWLKRSARDIFILPQLKIGTDNFQVDVLAELEGKTVLAICEPGSVTPRTEAILQLLKDINEIEVIVVLSRYGSTGNTVELFPDQLESGKFRLMSVVPPPFDDVYEYDIWMFETIFRDLFREG